jgi:predicted ArsR family transcriptional regulator
MQAVMTVREMVMAALDAEALDASDAIGLTAIELAAAVGVTKNTAKRHLNAAHGAGIVHVSGWQRSKSGPPAAMYRAGEGKDKPKPKPYTVNQRAVRYIRRHKAVIKLRKARAAGTLNPYMQLVAN